MELIDALRGHILLAMPSLQNSAYEHAVIYLCENQPDGAVGIMINKPLIYPLGFIFEQMGIVSNHLDQTTRPVLYGGPIHPERGFVLHRPVGAWRSSLLLNSDVTLTTSNDIIHAFAENRGPKDAVISLGFIGWSAEQLKQELLDNRWLVGTCTPELLYEVPFDARWQHVADSMGIHRNSFIEGGGHA